MLSDVTPEGTVKVWSAPVYENVTNPDKEAFAAGVAV
jgi:hypothetical protein